MGRPRNADARAALLQAAGEILAESGALALTVDEVVRRSGVAKTTLYRHFGSADGLIFALTASRVAAAESPGTGSLRGDLRAILLAYGEMFEEPLSRELFVWLLTKAMQSPQGAALFAAARIQSGGPTVVALKRAIERGEIPASTNIEMAMHVIQGPLISKRVIGNGRLAPEELELLLNMTMRALAGGSPLAGDGLRPFPSAAPYPSSTS
ncbi:MAG: TetR/AcrR family transcriptional regulator [Dehalococcoidia bacterium]|nr:TetR/AcrR family transcriptional regulator [Dehalococcoidia bacterium]NUQ56480.1 TetR/AcrR family transcriptional regulator [Dehalococcoidia bacterium]